MPIAPSPMTYRCQKCGWSQTTTPKSDALMPGDYYDACPQCGDESLESSPADLVSAVVMGVVRKVRELLP